MSILLKGDQLKSFVKIRKDKSKRISVLEMYLDFVKKTHAEDINIILEASDFDEQTLIDIYSRKAKQITPEYLEIFLSFGLKIDNQDRQGNTLLMSAISSGNEDLTYYLIDKGVDINKANKKGSKPIHITTSNSNLLLFVLENGGLESLDAQNNEGYTLLMLCACLHNGIMERVLEYNPNLELANNQGNTVFDLAEKTSKSIINN